MIPCVVKSESFPSLRSSFEMGKVLDMERWAWVIAIAHLQKVTRESVRVEQTLHVDYSLARTCMLPA